MIKKIAVQFDNFLYRKFLKNLLKSSKLGYGVIVEGAERGANYEHMYNNKAEGNFFVGKVVDRILLNLPAVKATQGRKDEIKRILWNEIQNNVSKNIITRVVDLASGGARYLRELKEEHSSGSVESVCIDKSFDSVALGRFLSGAEKVSNIKFIKGDLFKLNKLKLLSKKVKWIPNVFVASGIFIYFSDDTVKAILKEMFDSLPQNGIVVFSSYETLNTRKLMRKTMQTSDGQEWTLYYRKPEFWRALLMHIGYRDVFIYRDQWKMNNICTARK